MNKLISDSLASLWRVEENEKTRLKNLSDKFISSSFGPEYFKYLLYQNNVDGVYLLVDENNTRKNRSYLTEGALSLQYSYSSMYLSLQKRRKNTFLISNVNIYNLQGLAQAFNQLNKYV